MDSFKVLELVDNSNLTHQIHYLDVICHDDTIQLSCQDISKMKTHMVVSYRDKNRKNASLSDEDINLSDDGALTNVDTQDED
jgi:hypothetical protein